MKKYPITCGAAMRCVDPPTHLMGLLRGPMEIFGSVHDSVYIRAIAIGCGDDKVLMVSHENPRSLLPEQYVAELSELTGIPKNNILYICTHNHSAVEIRSFPEMNVLFGGGTEAEKAAYDEYERFLHDSMVEAVTEAISAMRPARLGWATGESYINANRLQDYTLTDENGQTHLYVDYGAVLDAPVDRALFVLRIEDLSGKPIAFHVNYAIHNVLTHRNMDENGLCAISGDVGGGISQLLERQNPGSVAMWSSGAAGDVQPAYMKTLFAPDPDTGEQIELSINDQKSIFALLDAVVYRHYSDVKRTMSQISCTLDAADGIFADDTVVEAPSTAGAPVKVRLHLIRIGDLALMGVSGEPFTKLGFAIKNAASVRDTVLVTHDGSAIQNGYTQDDESAIRILKSYSKPHGLRKPKLVPGYIEKALVDGTKELFARSMK